MIDRRKFLTIAGLTGLAVTPLACDQRGPNGPIGTLSQSNNGWRVAASNSSGLDSEKLRQLSSYLRNPAENIHSVLIARHGELAFQEYYSGEDEKFNDGIGYVHFGPEALHDLRSLTKSVVSLMLGIALDKGWIRGLDDSVLSYMPQHRQKAALGMSEVSFKHALTMSSGIHATESSVSFSDPRSTSLLLDAAPDQCEFVVGRSLVNAPGAAFDYTNLNPTLVGCALAAATGKSLDQLVAENIFKPLGISKYEWHRIPSTGQLCQGWGLRMLPLDTLKIGQLILSNGIWEQEQIVSRGWIEAATRTQFELNQKFSYGYFIWTGQYSGVEYSVLRGTGGQYLYVAPSLDLVALLHAGRYKLKKDEAVRPIETAFEEFILPSINN